MKPTNNRIFCIGSKRPKMLFETQSKADNFIKFNSEEISSQSKKAPTRSYYCSFCCGWHVTSVVEEERAKHDDESDEKLWEVIALASKSKKKIKEKKIEEIGTIQKSKSRKFPGTEQVYILRVIAERIDKTAARVESALVTANIEKLRLNFSELIELEKELRARSNEFGIDVSSIDKRYNKIAKYKQLFDEVFDYFVDDTKRKDFLKEISDEDFTNLKNIIINNIDIVSKIKFCFEQIRTKSIGFDSKEIEQLCNEIITEYIPKLKGATSKLKKKFKQDAKKILSNVSHTQNSINNHYKNLLLTIIKHLEEAYKAYKYNDFELCKILINKAECLLPDVTSDVELTLYNQILNLKGFLNNKE